MKKSIAVSVLILTFSFFVGCSNSLSEFREEKSQDFGSLEFGKNGARVNYNSLEIGSIDSAKVYVSGFGINEEISVSCKIQDGIGSFRIEKIPVGKNRIITVQGFDSSNKEIADAVL